MTMVTYDFRNADYCVCGLRGYKLDQALRLWKAKFETIKHFKRDVIKHSSLEELGNFVEEMWDNILPVAVPEALREGNVEKRRVMFDCIGVSTLFRELNPELLDRQMVHKIRTRWDEHNNAYQHEYDDIYELYRLGGNKLFAGVYPLQRPESIYSVRCWCTTTGREYWIYVPEEAALGRNRWQHIDDKPDALRAIAWTIRIDISSPKRIYRQGDIIIAEESEGSQTVSPYHLSKEQYLALMFSET